MIDFEHELVELLDKYYLDIPGDNFAHIEEIFKDKLSQILKKENVAIWGAGEHTRRIWELIPRNINLVSFIDKNSELHGEHLYNIPIYSPSDIDQLNIDVFIVSSYNYRNDIIHFCRTKYPNCRVINLYEEVDEYCPSPNNSI